MNQWAIIYEYRRDHTETTVIVKPVQATKRVTFRSPISIRQFLGIALLAIGLGGVLGPYTPNIRLETAQALKSYQQSAISNQQKPLPKSAPVVFEPLITPDGASIDPINNEFSLIVPKVGINAAVMPGINPMSPNSYTEALNKGIAHASTSFYPNEDGTVYLFSHSTNYDWFVKDLNAVFYMLKNLEKGDVAIIIYKGTRYTYKITDKKVVSPSSTAYLAPTAGKRNLILQTCWPPGSISERLLIFADLIEEQTHNT